MTDGREGSALKTFRQVDEFASGGGGGEEEETGDGIRGKRSL